MHLRRITSGRLIPELSRWQRTTARRSGHKKRFRSASFMIIEKFDCRYALILDLNSTYLCIGNNSSSVSTDLFAEIFISLGINHAVLNFKTANRARTA